MVSVLDCGDLAGFGGDPATREYGYALQSKQWTYLEVANPDFIKTSPVAGF